MLYEINISTAAFFATLTSFLLQFCLINDLCLLSHSVQLSSPSGVAREVAHGGHAPPPTFDECFFSPINLRCYVILVCT